MKYNLKFNKASIPRVHPWLCGFLDSITDKDKQYVIEIKEYRPKRSLDANAYMWALLDKLAEKLGTSKEHLYREAVKDIGGNNDIVCVQEDAVESLCKGWSHNGIGWVTEVTDSKIPKCKNVILYYGSSTYNTQQMSRLINNIIADCEWLGIETKCADEVRDMCDRWGKK